MMWCKRSNPQIYEIFNKKRPLNRNYFSESSGVFLSFVREKCHTQNRNERKDILPLTGNPEKRQPF